MPELPATPGAAAAGAGMAAKESIETLFEALLKWVVPLLLFIAGFFAAGAIGGFNSLWNVLQKAFPNAPTTTYYNYGAAAIMLFLWLAVGGLFLAIAHAHSKNLIAVGVGRGFGAFFVGAGLGWIPQLTNPVGASNGLLDTWASKLQTAVTPPASTP